MSKTFWPGFKWRVLAHKRTGRGKNKMHTGESLDLEIGMERFPVGYPGTRMVMDGDWEFDELVIDDWFHIEQMNDRKWWIGIGNQDNDYYRIYVNIDGKGKASIYIQKS